MDAQALITGQQTATEAVSPAMLAVTSLRHLTPDKERGAVSPLMPSWQTTAHWGEGSAGHLQQRRPT